MSLKSDIKKKSNEIKDSHFVSGSVSFIPTIETSSLTFGSTGLLFPATVLYIDMRGSTEVLNTHQRSVVAKIHMTYYHAIVKVAKDDGGEIRSFNGDSLLVFFYGNSDEVVRKAVCSALRMKYALTQIVNESLENYMDIDFGIGIDCGEILATKVGIGGANENKDLIWIGNAVNRSTRISDSCSDPFYVGISRAVYCKLDERLLHYTKRDYWGDSYRYNVWAERVFEYNNNQERMYQTSCQIEFE